MADTPHPQYEVISQRKTTQPDGKGGFHDMWRIHYRTPSGTDSYVDMPATHYTAENVHTAIAHEMKHIEDVHGLGTGHAPPRSTEAGA